MHEISKDEFFERITRLSFVMAMVVIYIHANNLNYYDWSSKDFNNIAWIVENLIGNGLGSMAVPTFFTVSGYLFFRNIDINSFDYMKQIFSKQKRRMPTLVIPYLVWNTFGTIFYMFIPRISFVNAMMNGDAIVVSPSNIIKGLFLHSAYFPFWYLASLIILVIITPIIALILKKRAIGIIVLLILVTGSILGVQFPELSSRSFYFYFLGAYLGVYGRQLVERTYGHFTIMILGLLLLVSVIIRTFFNCLVITNTLLLISPFLCWGIISMANWKVTKFHKQSFFIFASHIIIVTSINKVLLKIGTDTPQWVILSYIIAPIITLGMIYIMYRVFVRFFSTFYAFICGSRS